MPIAGPRGLPERRGPCCGRSTANDFDPAHPGPPCDDPERLLEGERQEPEVPFKIGLQAICNLSSAPSHRQRVKHCDQRRGRCADRTTFNAAMPTSPSCCVPPST